MPPTNRGRHTDIDKKVGARIKLLRLERGLSQEQLGDALGLTFQQIQKYEKGTNAVASTRIPLLCKILKIEPNDLFRFNGFNFHGEDIVIDTDAFALRVGMRAQKLGPKARLNILACLDLIEANNDCCP